MQIRVWQQEELKKECETSRGKRNKKLRIRDKCELDDSNRHDGEKANDEG